MLPSNLIVASGIIAFYVIYQGIRQKWRMAGHPLPPSPKGLPIIGNALQMPTRLGWLTFKRWSEELNSDIIFVNAAGTSIIILNSVKMVNDLFDRRSTIYSGRPHSVMLNELMGWEWALPAMQYGDQLKIQRRLFQKYFHPLDTSHQPRARDYMYKLLPQLLDAPQDFRSHVQHTVGAMVISQAYGIPAQTKDDPYVRIAEAAVRPAAVAFANGVYLVDAIPFLKHIPDWFPGAGFKRDAKIWKLAADKLRDEPFAAAEKAISEGSAQPSFSSAALDCINREKDDAEHQRRTVKDTAAIFFAAGSDTTVGSIINFFLAMVCFPEVQARAHRDLDAVLGGVRLPDFSDEQNLPYISAIVKEVLRWRPMSPLGVPHATTEDDIYEGYFIPKNSVVVPNIWSMLHNKDVYPEPSKFKPERYLNEDGQLNNKIRDPKTMAFGFGRRTCVGPHLAQSTMWIAIASILAVFEITKAKDENGVQIEPSMGHVPGSVAHPEPFQCDIKPRSKEAEALIRALGHQ